MPEGQGGSLRLHGPIGTGPPRAGWRRETRPVPQVRMCQWPAGHRGTARGDCWPVESWRLGLPASESESDGVRPRSWQAHSASTAGPNASVLRVIARLGVHVRKDRRPHSPGPPVLAACSGVSGSVRTSDRKRLSVVVLAYSVGLINGPGTVTA
jgi:hypothetical protein